MPAFRDTAQNPKDRDRWLKGLRDNSPAEFYGSVMRGGLDLLDKRLSSDEAQKGPAQKAWSYGCSTSPWPLPLPTLFGP
jgi:hypothetical protein